MKHIFFGDMSIKLYRSGSCKFISRTSRVWGARRINLPLLCCVGCGDLAEKVSAVRDLSDQCPYFVKFFGVLGSSGRCRYDGENEPRPNCFNLASPY